MIELGSMFLRDDVSITETRQKLFAVVKAFGGSDVLATRTATAISEAARQCLMDGEPATLDVALAETDRRMNLHLRLGTTNCAADIAPLRLFFERVAVNREGSFNIITAELSLPLLIQQVSPELIARERARIASKSRAELMEELQLKNQQLEEYNERLEATVAKRTEELQLANTQMRRDLDVGSAYVRNMIPPPMQEPVSINWKYVPSSTLGGDTIGYHWIDPEHLAIYLIDVTGHGLDSALLAVTITNVIRSHSLPRVDMTQPDQVVAALNNAFPGEQHGQKYFTIWYGVYAPRDRTLTWTGGGHHPAVLVIPNRSSPKLLEAGGMIMGCLPEAEFPAETCQVPPGSRMLLFSDGVFEIFRDRKHVWDLEGAIEFMSQSSPTLDDLLHHVHQLRGSTQLDDDFSVIEAGFF